MGILFAPTYMGLRHFGNSGGLRGGIKNQREPFGVQMFSGIAHFKEVVL